MQKKAKEDSELLEPLILLEDEPVPGYSIDELSLRPFSEIVASAAIGTRGPFTIGVYGDWGHGKTSVLRQARSLLSEKAPQIITVWFNAWQFQEEIDPIIPLVVCISREIDEAIKKKPGLLSKIGRGAKAALSKTSVLRGMVWGKL